MYRFIRVIVSLVMWFPVSILILWGASYFFPQWIAFNWFLVFVMAIIIGWILDIINKPDH